MPIDPIPRALYPVVPKALGVPAVLRSAATIADTVTLGYLGISDKLSDIIGTEPVKWGVFDSNGGSIADYDTFMSNDYQNDSKISQYPVELGGFVSYNKVETPFDVSVILVCGGGEDRRAAFQVAIEAARKSLQLYSVFTPDRTYTQVNFTTIAVRRSLEDGAYMIKALLSGVEVRQRAQSKFSSPTSPSSAGQIDQGQVQSVDDASFDSSGVA